MKTFIGVMAVYLMLITPAYANGSSPEECNLCSLDPTVLTALVQACQTQPGGTACQVLRTLAGMPSEQ